MKARELIKLLKKVPPNTEVYLEAYTVESVTGITIDDHGVLVGEERARRGCPTTDIFQDIRSKAPTAPDPEEEK